MSQPHVYARVLSPRSLGVEARLEEDPLESGDLMLVLDAGTKIRFRMNEESANYLADAIHRWYASVDDKEET